MNLRLGVGGVRRVFEAVEGARPHSYTQPEAPSSVQGHGYHNASLDGRGKYQFSLAIVASTRPASVFAS